MNKVNLTIIFIFVLSLAGLVTLAFFPQLDEVEEEVLEDISTPDLEEDLGARGFVDGENPDYSSENFDFYNPVEWDSRDVYAGHEAELLTQKPDWWSGTDEQFFEDRISSATFEKAGTFTEGPYKGQTLVLAVFSSDGLGSTGNHRFVVNEDTDSWTALENYSSNTDYLPYLPWASSDSGSYFEEFEAPALIELSGLSPLVILSDLSGSEAYLASRADLIKVINLSGTDLSDTFTRAYVFNNCTYFAFGDGLSARYTDVPTPFIDDYRTSESGFSFVGEMKQTLPFVSEDGNFSRTKAFSLTPGTCGFSNCVLKRDVTAADEALLEKSGTVDGWNVYYVDIDMATFEPDDPLEISITNDAYNGYQRYVTQMGYEDGLTLPYSLYIDQGYGGFMELANGKYTQIHDADIAPAAECGKPVIYLYPPTETEVSVRVDEIDFTITEPEHGKDGWTVLAQPSGELTNLEDGKDYPYLFWEGNSYENINLDTGWTVAKNEIRKTLPRALKDMGLNHRETKDFMEFWYPLLMEEPGDFIEFNFVDQRKFDLIAPLTVTPKPDHILRIFMVYRGTNHETYEMPDFKHQERNGFSLIEWGGTLY